jgi:hypothetical protein
MELYRKLNAEYFIRNPTTGMPVPGTLKQRDYLEGIWNATAAQRENNARLDSGVDLGSDGATTLVQAVGGVASQVGGLSNQMDNLPAKVAEEVKQAVQAASTGSGSSRSSRSAKKEGRIVSPIAVVGDDGRARARDVLTKFGQLSADKVKALCSSKSASKANSSNQRTFYKDWEAFKDGNPGSDLVDYLSQTKFADCKTLNDYYKIFRTSRAKKTNEEDLE